MLYSCIVFCSTIYIYTYMEQRLLVTHALLVIICMKEQINFVQYNYGICGILARLVKGQIAILDTGSGSHCWAGWLESLMGYFLYCPTHQYM